MKFVFKITLDAITGVYHVDAETVYASEEDKQNVDVAAASKKASAMFVKLSQEYSKKFLEQNKVYTKEEREKMN